MSLATRTWEALPGYVRAADEGLGFPLRTWLSGLCDLAQPTVDMLAMPSLADPATTPRVLLPWVAAIAGVDITQLPEDTMRDILAAAPYGDVYLDVYLDEYEGGQAARNARARGSIPAIIQRVGLTLTGTRHVEVECPYLGDPMRMRIGTYTGETPSPTATAVAARMEAPAWIRLTVGAGSGVTYTTLTSRYSTYAALAGSGLTYDGLAKLT